jgi:predicted nucleotidyltransferase
VSNPRIFGSVARGEDREGSDLDMVVDPLRDKTTYAHLGLLCDELETALGTKVDLVTSGALRPGISARIFADLVPL